ncbi:MAG: hypothetical protein Q4C42_05320 [Clostridia bacterium]|nr:hypothetical protein [Clostridia bacterium]
MKNMKSWQKLLIGAGMGIILGTVCHNLITGLMNSASDPYTKSFYVGLIVTILGLFGCMKGSPNAGVGSANGFDMNAVARSVVEENKMTGAKGKNFLANRVLEIRPAALALLFFGISEILWVVLSNPMA